MPQWVATPAGNNSTQCIPPPSEQGVSPWVLVWVRTAGMGSKDPARCAPSLIILQRMREKLDEQFPDNMPLCENFARLFKISTMK